MSYKYTIILMKTAYAAKLASGETPLLGHSQIVGGLLLNFSTVGVGVVIDPNPNYS